MAAVRTCPVNASEGLVMSLWISEHFSHSASLTGDSYPMLHGHLLSLGSCSSTNPRGFWMRWSSSWCWVRSRRAHVCRHLLMVPECSGALCSSMALPWNSLCCLGWIWCHMRRAEQRWAGSRFSFQVISLSPEILSAILELLSSRLLNDTVFELSWEIEIWAFWDNDFPVIHLT